MVRCECLSAPIEFLRVCTRTPSQQNDEPNKIIRYIVKINSAQSGTQSEKPCVSSVTDWKRLPEPMGAVKCCTESTDEYRPECAKVAAGSGRGDQGLLERIFCPSSCFNEIVPLSLETCQRPYMKGTHKYRRLRFGMAKTRTKKGNKRWPICFGLMSFGVPIRQVSPAFTPLTSSLARS